MASDFDGLLDLIPIDDIAKKLGVPEDVAEAAVKQVIPAIIGGMAANAKDAGGAKSLEKALTKHASKAPSGKAKVSAIDTADGEKIVNNVFGAKKSQVVAAVADTSKSGDVTKELIAQLLPIVAPIVIAFVAKQFLGQKDAPAAEKPKAAPASSDGGIGDLLGGLLGSSQGQEIIGSVLGGLLGGGKK
jgi:hypothetical protein